MDTVRALFPRARVFAVLGNHDTSPGDYFGSSAEMQWLYASLGAASGPFGRDLAGDAAALASLQGFGWYTTTLTPQTALIALNTNYWTTLNPANSGNTSAAGLLGEAQFVWLTATLEALAAANRSALVIGHIPPSPGAWHPPNFLRFRVLLTRFPVVLAQFFGHNHLDEFILVRACSPTPPPPLPYPGPWVETRDIKWCSGGNLPVGDVWGRGTQPDAPHCPYVPASNGTAEGRVALCEGVCGNLTDCRGFTWYPDGGGGYGACCFRTSCDEKPPAPGSTAVCFEKEGGAGACGGAQEPLHTLYVTPSLTEGFPASNPGLRAFTVDADTLAPLEATTYWANLSLANENWALAWQLEYAATQQYGLADLSAAEWGRAVERMSANGSAEFRAFWRATVKGFEGLGPCDDACKVGVLSRLNGTADGM
jgi:hypothetical protein